jgi:hypothetical protein
MEWKHEREEHSEEERITFTEQRRWRTDWGWIAMDNRNNKLLFIGMKQRTYCTIIESKLSYSYRVNRAIYSAYIQKESNPIQIVETFWNSKME